QVVRHGDRRRDGREVQELAALVGAELVGLGQAVAAREVQVFRLERALAGPRAAGVVDDRDVLVLAGVRRDDRLVERLLERRAAAVDGAARTRASAPTASAGGEQRREAARRSQHR